MYSRKYKSKTFRASILPILISNIMWSGCSIAGNYNLLYTSTKIDPKLFNLSDVIYNDGNYNANVTIDNPNQPLVVYFAKSESDGKSYNIDDYSINIHGNNISNPNYYNAFYGLTTKKTIPFH
ncbi:putative autotransporter protein [Yersinia frederiksenii]|nr:putative autotransporter protein [Yersinia frederiksenii]